MTMSTWSGLSNAPGGAVEGRLVEVPPWRGGLPDEPGEVVPVLLVAGAAAFGREVELVPPLQLSGWRQRLLVGLLAADQVAAHRDDRPAPLRPEGGHDSGGLGSPRRAGGGRPPQ